VYGSLDELEKDFGVRPTDLHRPAIDELVRPNPDDPTGQSMMRRIPDVLDVWFDSGSMPFAQVHYPFDNREWFDSHNPADFIVEYIGQTRGWFYTMHILATALFDRPAFSRVISHGIVLGSDGNKMSKSLGNYPDVGQVFELDGADAMRWFLMSSSVIRGGNLVVTEEGIREGVRQFLLPLWSTYYFFTLYAGERTPQRRTNSPHLLDRYILAKLADTARAVTGHLEALDSPLAAAELRDFADILTNWYVRRSRDRFWSGDDRDAIDTLYTALETLCRVAAPLAPLITEEVWRGLTGGESVHLTDWPDVSEFEDAPDLVAAMDRVRDIARAGLALRKSHNRRVRLPLASLSVVGTDIDQLAEFSDIVAEELNVKNVTWVEYSIETEAAFGIARKIQVNARVLGPRIGSDVQRVIGLVKAGDWTLVDGGVAVADHILREGEYESVLDLADPSTAVEILSHGGYVVLETDTTPSLEREGLARDLIRAIQQERKNQGLDISDRIRLTVTGGSAVADAARHHEELIRSETLATALSITADGGAHPVALSDGHTVLVQVVKS
jgi:isoleucyl-tRNA synthetase